MTAIKEANDLAPYASGGKDSGSRRQKNHDLRSNLLKAIMLLVAVMVLAFVSVSDGKPVSSGSDTGFPAATTIVDAGAHHLSPNRP